MLAIMALVVIVGTALDMTPIILILTPILMPIIEQASIDPVYFGVLFIINNSIGLITPTVGIILKIVCDSRASAWRTSRTCGLSSSLQLVVLFLIGVFPALVTVPAKWFTG